jgi:hypothetical protein
MAERGKKRPRLSAALRRTIAADTASCFVDNEVLGEKDVATLRRILAGREDPGVEINRKRALGALARSDQSAAAGALLGRVLGDRKAPSDERAAAAAYLALLPPRAAEKPLLDALSGSTGLLRFEIVQSLGQIGTAKALTRLRRLGLGEGDVATRALALAELAIGLREGQGGKAAADLKGKLELGWDSIPARRIEAEAVEEAIDALGGPAWGVKLRRDYALRFDCGRRRNVVLLNEKLRPGRFLKDAQAAPMIAALIVAQAERRLEHYNTRWLLLSSPGKDGIDMAMVRPSGEPAFAGRAVPDGDGLAFRLRDTGLERTPAEIEGRVTDDEVKWTIRVWRGPIRAKRAAPVVGQMARAAAPVLG